MTISSLLLMLTLGAEGTLAAEEPPATGVFSPAESLAEARQGHTATLLLDGRVLVVGGVGIDFFQVASAEVWEPGDG